MLKNAFNRHEIFFVEEWGQSGYLLIEHQTLTGALNRFNGPLVEGQHRVLKKADKDEQELFYNWVRLDYRSGTEEETQRRAIEDAEQQYLIEAMGLETDLSQVEF